MMKRLRRLLVMPFVLVPSLLLSGCNMMLLDPKGIIALAEKHLLIDATLLMLIVVIPVMIMSVVFAFHFREKNKKANYRPDWHDSTALEAICWIIPCIIIGILGVMTWVTTHQLSPYRPLAKKQLVIQAVSLDWKWLFIYPDQHVATVNYLVIPTNTPIQFQITADAPMNAFQIPQIAGQIYAMPGMRTKLHVLATAPGNYYGFSANYSGDGFATMHFNVQATSAQQFAKWVKTAQHAKRDLSIKEYRQLAEPSAANPKTTFSEVQPGLFTDIIMKYMMPNTVLSQHVVTKSPGQDQGPFILAKNEN